MDRGILITGAGWVTPLGHDQDKVWNALLAGESGIDRISAFDTDGYSTRIAGEARTFDPCDWMERREARRLDRFSQFALASARMAADQADLNLKEADPFRAGAIIGSGSGGMATIEKGHAMMLQRGPGRVPPLSVPMMMGNAASAVISERFGLHGPSYGTACACSSGATAIAQAAGMIALGQADLMFAGGCEASITPLSLAAFGTCGALSRQNENPRATSRPFDASRDGFVMAEGGCVLILESAEHAAARGATALAELAGYGLTSDAHHITQPNPTFKPAAKAILSALAMAGEEPGSVDYINAHGTSTPLNDPAEIKAIRLALGDHAEKVAVSSTKSMLGHMLGAAGAVEAVITALALKHGRVPPTINVDCQDPECDLDVVPQVARECPGMSLALSDSFAFGGHNACLALRRV